ncbi:hypothetical protein PQX77_011101 [Marasmius sp. AFHP31]|nr:hypothetical protein PQX77_011101 [Marasmius sp. AFHP31]
MERRSPWLAQTLGLVRSEVPTFIFHEELVNGMDFVSQYPKYGIVPLSLCFTRQVAVEALCVDETLTLLVTRRWDNWMFDPKTRSRHFDIASASSREWQDHDFSCNPIPLPQGSQPQLIGDDIATYFEKTFGDVLYLYASFGGTNTRNVSSYAFHGVLTFGSVVQWERGVIAYFPSTPSPELHLESQSRNITASYSVKVPSRIELQIHNVHHAPLNLYFSLCLPLKERNQLRAAYLSQHPLNADYFTYFIDEIGFSLHGDWSHTPPTTRRPAYLFVSPLQSQYVNGMHHIRYPLLKSPFHWASDPEGRHVIPENDWVSYGIPKLKVQTWIGSDWTDDEYVAVRQHLVGKKYGSNGKQYALDHGYPELIHGDPHDGRMKDHRDSDKELENPHEHKPFHPGTHLTSPSPSSMINVPTNLECAPEEGPSITMHLANESGFWDNTSADTASRTHEDEGKFKAVSQPNDTDGSGKHQRLPVIGGPQTMGETSISPSICAPRGPQRVVRTIASPKSVENNLAGRKASRTAGLTKSGATLTQRSRTVYKVIAVANKATNQHKLVSTGSQTVKSVRSPAHLACQNPEMSIGVSHPQTRSQATGSLEARKAVTVPQKPTSSRRSEPAGKMVTVSNNVAKPPNVKREDKDLSELVKRVSTKVNPAVSWATRQV